MDRRRFAPTAAELETRQLLSTLGKLGSTTSTETANANSKPDATHQGKYAPCDGYVQRIGLAGVHGMVIDLGTAENGVGSRIAKS